MKRNGLVMALIVFCIVLSVSVSAATTSTSSSTSIEPTNIVVDFDSTSFDSSLSPGDSGIMNLVIKNTGGYRADTLQVYIPSSATVNADKRFYVGRLDAGGSKTLPVVIRVENNAKTGLTAVNIHITYNGYKADGSQENNLLTKWDVPLRIYGKPLFQLTPTKTTYYKDNLDELTLEGTLLASVKDLESTLSSSCLTIIGSSKKYLGNLKANEKFNISYQIKPSAEGACTASTWIEYTDESGSTASRNITVGLNIESAGVDFKVLNVSYKPTGPGETVNVKVALKNVGEADAKDTTLSLTLSEPFVPVDTAEKYVGTVEGGETFETGFDIAVAWDAEIQPYSIPLNITYKVGGTSYSVKKDIGIDVSGQIILEVINVQQATRSLQIEVANIGTRTAEGVKAILTTQETENRTFARQQTTGAGTQQRQTANPLNMLTGRGVRTGGQQQAQNRSTISQTGGTQQMVEYKSDIKPTKQTTFTFETTVSGPITLTLEYTGLNNERVTQTEVLSVGGTMSAGTFTGAQQTSGTSTTARIVYAAIALLLIWTIYRRYKREKIIPGSVRKRIPKQTMEKVDILGEKINHALGRLSKKFSRIKG
ncbi:MAG: hypothetical protein V1921_05535 [Candidatus Altiarchaeota archaeon]